MSGLANRLQRTRETQADRWLFRFANGLAVQTDPFMRPDVLRVLPVGGPQDVILNRLVNLPEIVAGKNVFDPFAGSGVLGLMALRLAAAHVDFLDISERAQEFQIANAKRNGFGADRFRALLGSIDAYETPAPYDVVLANPPFVPTPPGIEGSITSNGGPRGDTYAEMLLARLDRLLHANGEAFVYVIQFLDQEKPAIADKAVEYLPGRVIEFTPAQRVATPLDDYVAAYLRCFPTHEVQIRQWEVDLRDRYSRHAALQHYVMHVQPKHDAAGTWQLAENLREKYGHMAYPEAANRELALARVMENVVPRVH